MSHKKSKLLGDPDEHGGLQKESGEARLEVALGALSRLQTLNYVANANSVLVVVQGIDAAGKDGTIKSVFRGLNPEGCRVANFKEPTPEEAAHDFLWRIHKQCPARGEVMVFNRSHYESVLVERVTKLVHKNVWSRRYEQINQFEKLLTDNGTIILKFFLHISKGEQKRRFESRESDPTRRWKLSHADWKNRRNWAAYQKAFAAMLEKTSTSHAPWTVVPSNHKWYRNLVVAEELVRQLSKYTHRWKRANLRRGDVSKAV